MWAGVQRVGVVTILSSGIIALAAGDALAQRCGLVVRAGGSAGFSGSAHACNCSPSRAGFISRGATSYGPSSLYASGYSSSYPYVTDTADPYGGYLRGSAEVIGAQGRMVVNQQQAALRAEGVTQARMESRRREFDQWLYERAHRPTLEDERERLQQQELRRSRNDPPLAEVYSAKALNTLLEQLQKLDGRGIRVTPVDLGEDVARHINLTTGESDGHVGLLKNNGRLDWPIALRTHLGRERRDRIDDLVQEATQTAKNGKQASAALQEMDRSVRRFHQDLRAVINDIPPSQYIEAKRFLVHLDAALRALQRPDAAEYFNGRYLAQGNGVAQLIQHMIKQGLRFAPAVAGDEAAYVALHRALTAYEAQAQSVLLAER